MIAPLAVAIITGALIDVIGLIGVATGAAMGLLTLVAYIARQVRRGVNLLDEVTKATPERLDKLEKQRQGDRDEHQAAHAEMLSAVTMLGDKVDGLADKLDDLAERQEKDHDHLEALTRDLDVPVRGRAA